MRAFVDPDLCIGCTQCAGICPAVFTMEGTLAVALAGDPAACEAMRKQQAEQINANSAQDIARFVLCENANDD